MGDLREALRRGAGEETQEPDLGRVIRRGEHMRRRRSRGRLAATAAACAAVIAIAVPLIGHRGGDRSAHIATADAPPIPSGWKGVVFGQVQFAVPQTWPVYSDGRCYDRARPGVYLGPSVSATCPGSTVGALTIQVNRFVGGHTPGVGRLTDMHGVIGGVSEDTTDPGSFTVALPDQQTIIDIDLGQRGDIELATEIISTIGRAPNPQPLPPAPTAPTSTTRTSKVAAYCDAVERYRTSGRANTSDGLPTPEAADLMDQIAAAAPPDAADAARTMATWARAGAQRPAPTEVSDAAVQSTNDWLRYCNGS